ncbi:MAG: hypothetical protein MUE44_01480 [Oscillatoriaceae cyanobacterium Prado104]|nr:hypothetical protein [Oscillatoriaceae cyanobacterium Prado104]
MFKIYYRLFGVNSNYCCIILGSSDGAVKSRVCLEKADRVTARSASRWLDTLNPCQVIVPLQIWYYQKLINAKALIPTMMGSLRYCQK